VVQNLPSGAQYFLEKFSKKFFKKLAAGHCRRPWAIRKLRERAVERPPYRMWVSSTLVYRVDLSRPVPGRPHLQRTLALHDAEQPRHGDAGTDVPSGQAMPPPLLTRYDPGSRREARGRDGGFTGVAKPPAAKGGMLRRTPGEEQRCSEDA
jgi:hypothetical protein